MRARSRLERAGIAEASLESEVLLRHTLDIDRAAFFASLEEQPGDAALELTDSLVERREQGEPLAYILGRREFYGLDILVTPAVLIPRQETELLVDCILDLGRDRAGITVADVGTGSGAIAVAAAVNLPSCRIHATDSSQAALRVAAENCQKHSVDDRVELSHGDLLDTLDVRADVIASNPPYVTTGELRQLGREVAHEPLEALDGGPDGLDVIRRLFHQAPWPHLVQADRCSWRSTRASSSPPCHSQPPPSPAGSSRTAATWPASHGLSSSRAEFGEP